MLYTISAGYDKDKNMVYIQFYDSATNDLRDYFIDFKAYCLTDNETNFPKKFLDYKTVTKYDALNDNFIQLLKVRFDNPYDVKQTHPEEGDEERFWENHIKFFMSCIYDNDIKMGMAYRIVNGELEQVIDEVTEKTVVDLLKKFPEDNNDVTKELLRLFEYPAPKFRRASVDIEVKNQPKKMPVPAIANYPVLCVCFKNSDGRRIAFLLVRPEKKFTNYPDVDELHLFYNEKDLLVAVINYITSFPIILTFNGDGFDLQYLKNRALRFDIPEENIPFNIIQVKGKEIFTKVLMRNTVHIDLSKFFKINAIKNYAFTGKYKDTDLDTLSKAFLKRGKLNQTKRMVGDMEYDELINYCMRDAELTYDLSAFDNDLVMNLVTIISRITKLPIEIVTRRAVGGWIESFLMAQHRKRDWLIPRPEDIVKMKGNFATKADVKGKQFQAALVIEPETGVFFPMIVVDYGSLYPSIIKLYNIGYSTICCEHGKEWQNLSIDTKRFIWLLCNLSINKEDDNQCHIEKIMKLMKNIEREIENTKEIIKEKTNNDSMKSNENLITKIWKIHYLKKKERENQKNTEKNLNKTLLDGKNQKIIEMNGNEENAENFYANLLNIKVQNVNNVETLMNELLKYITSMEEMNGKEETFILLLEKWIGKNYNSFAPIVTKLLDMSKCGSNTFAGLPHWLCLRNRAIESEFIGTLRDLRLGHYKALGKTSSWYKCVEQTVKVFMNASYGVFSGRGKFQFYCPIASEEIAQIARSIIIDTVNQAKSSNIKVKGGDTDSLFVHEPNKDKIKVLQDWAKTKYGIDLELDKQFRFMAFSNRKKNYLSVYPDGTVDVKGLTGKKKHTPYFYRTYFEKAKSIVGSIQNENDVERGRKELKALIKEAYICLKQKKSSLRDLAFHVTASKRVVDYKKNIPQHIKAIIQLERAGYTFETGTVVDFIKTYRRSGVIPLELAKASDVDIDKYIEQLITLFEQLLDPFDVTFDEALGIQKMDKYLQ